MSNDILLYNVRKDVKGKLYNIVLYTTLSSTISKNKTL